MRLKAYRDEVLSIIPSFSEFKIAHVPRLMNEMADSLAVSACNFIPPLPPKLSYEIQVKYRPSLPDNVEFWKVFEDDAELTRFLNVIDEFADLEIDEDNQNEQAAKEKTRFKSRIGAHEIVQLSSNRIPKGLVPLERLFDSNDVAVKLEKKEDESDSYPLNLADESDPKLVNLASHLTEQQKSEYAGLLKEFSDIFA